MDQGRNTERRSIISTLTDPSTFPIVVPLLLAASSAFMVHDRAINTLQVQIEQLETMTNTENMHTVELNNLRSRLAVLERTASTRKEQYDAVAYDLKKFSEEIAALEVKNKYIAQQIAELKSRISKLENKK